MKKVKILKVVFEQQIPSWQIPKFRGAIVNKIGREHILFHNHYNDNQLRYAYPLIQYKTFNKKAGFICINEGTDDVHAFFSKHNWNINIEGREMQLSIESLAANNFNLQVWDKFFYYTIYEWIALNKANFEIYKKTETAVDRLKMLERILIGNILSFAKGVELTVEKPIELNILSVVNEKQVKYKGVQLVSFNAEFKTNFFIPNFIGLGKGVSTGFGIVKEKKKINSESNNL
jgi:hypothetical protein